MILVQYLKGDATYPQGDGPKIIAHICNDAGGWGKGFVLTQQANSRQASVHMPRIGAGLAGGKWEEIEPIIIRTLSAKNIPVLVYDPE